MANNYKNKVNIKLYVIICRAVKSGVVGLISYRFAKQNRGPAETLLWVTASLFLPKVQMFVFISFQNIFLFFFISSNKLK